MAQFERCTICCIAGCTILCKPCTVKYGKCILNDEKCKTVACTTVSGSTTPVQCFAQYKLCMHHCAFYGSIVHYFIFNLHLLCNFFITWTICFIPDLVHRAAPTAAAGENHRYMALWTSNQRSEGTLQQSVFCDLQFLYLSGRPQTSINTSKWGLKITL